MSSRIASYENEGLTFDVLDEGPLDGDVVVLLHGFPDRASGWRRVVPLLHARGLRTLAPDQRGYSPGARPAGRRSYAVQHLVGDVAALVERVGSPVHLVGHDWGAAVAWSTAAAHPELVRSLTAMSVPHPAAFAKALTSSTQGLKSWYMAFFQLPVVPEALGGRRGGVLAPVLRRGGMTREEVERFRTEIVAYGALPGGLAWYRALPFGDRGAVGRRVRVPTTMVWSDGDDFVGRQAVEATHRWVEAPYELVTLPGVTHWIPTQAPEAAADAVLATVARA